MIFSAMLFFSCGQSNEYQIHSSGLKYRFVEKSEARTSPQVGDALELNLQYKTENDSVLFNSYELRTAFRIAMRPASHEGGSVEDALGLLSVGDSIEFLVDATSFFKYTRKTAVPKYVSANSVLKFNARLVKILNSKEIEAERKLLHEQNNKNEQLLLDEYLKTNGITTEATMSGLYYVELLKGKGKRPSPQKTVKVHYTGYFINGQEFDSSLKRDKTFDFKLGKAEAIAGMEEGVSLMQVGGKARLIIPSHLAYGKEGKGRKIPPYATLIFEIELVEAE